MKRKNRFWYYFFLAGIIICLGGIVAIAITGETLLLWKALLVLSISIYSFTRERRAKLEAEARERQEWLDHMTEPKRGQEEEKPTKNE